MNWEIEDAAKGKYRHFEDILTIKLEMCLISKHLPSTQIQMFSLVQLDILKRKKLRCQKE